MELDYIDPECTHEQDKKIIPVSGYVAGKAYNEICKMIGGRLPDSKLEEEAPLAHEFFMTLFGVNVVENDIKIRLEAKP